MEGVLSEKKTFIFIIHELNINVCTFAAYTYVLFECIPMYTYYNLYILY